MAANDYVTEGEVKELLSAQTKMILVLTEAFSAIQAALLVNGTIRQSDLDRCLQLIRDSPQSKGLYERILETPELESFELLLRNFQGTIQ